MFRALWIILGRSRYNISNFENFDFLYDFQFLPSGSIISPCKGLKNEKFSKSDENFQWFFIFTWSRSRPNGWSRDLPSDQLESDNTLKIDFKVFWLVFGAFPSPRWLKKNNQNGAQTHPKRFSLGDFCRSQRGASPAWNLELLITKPCFLIVKLSFRYYLIVRNPRGWSSGSKNIPKDLQLGKSWKSIWNLSFAWISLILKDFGEFWWNFMNFDGFWRYFDGFRADTDSRGAASSRIHVLATLAMPTQRLEGVANLKTSFLSSYRRISKFRRAGSSIRLLKPATTVISG